MYKVLLRIHETTAKMYSSGHISGNSIWISTTINARKDFKTTKINYYVIAFVRLHRWDAAAAGTVADTWKISGFQSPAATSPSMTNPANVRIGRASCRERVLRLV